MDSVENVQACHLMEDCFHAWHCCFSTPNSNPELQIPRGSDPLFFKKHYFVFLKHVPPLLTTESQLGSQMGTLLPGRADQTNSDVR